MEKTKHMNAIDKQHAAKKSYNVITNLEGWILFKWVIKDIIVKMINTEIDLNTKIWYPFANSILRRKRPSRLRKIAPKATIIQAWTLFTVLKLF